MSGKVFSSPGISARPLTRYERLVEWLRAERYGFHARRWPSLAGFGRIVRRLIHGPSELDRLVKALEGGGYNAGLIVTSGPGQKLVIEDLSAVMQTVTFNKKDIRVRKRWWNK